MKSSTYLRWITAWWITAAAILAFGVFAKAQTPAGVINAPIYATGYISQAGGTNVTTKIPPQPNHPANQNVYVTSAVTGTWTIQLPNPAFEGQVLSFNCGYNVSAISVSSSDGSSLDSSIPTTCNANSGFVVQFDQRSNIWRNLGSNSTTLSGITVNNNAQLTALPSAITQATRLGYASAGDAPSILYTRNNSACSLNSGAGDGGSQVPTSDGKCWIASLPSPLDVRIWGAVGDGSHDDGPAINSALSAAAALGTAATVVVPAKSFKIATSIVLKPFVTLEMRGATAQCAVSPCITQDTTKTLPRAGVRGGKIVPYSGAYNSALVLNLTSPQQGDFGDLTISGFTGTWLQLGGTIAATIVDPVYQGSNVIFNKFHDIYVYGCGGCANVQGHLPSETPGTDASAPDQIATLNTFTNVYMWWATSYGWNFLKAADSNQVINGLVHFGANNVVATYQGNDTNFTGNTYVNSNKFIGFAVSAAYGLTSGTFFASSNLVFGLEAYGLEHDIDIGAGGSDWRIVNFTNGQGYNICGKRLDKGLTNLFTSCLTKNLGWTETVQIFPTENTLYTLPSGYGRMLNTTALTIGRFDLPCAPPNNTEVKLVSTITVQTLIVTACNATVTVYGGTGTGLGPTYPSAFVYYAAGNVWVRSAGGAGGVGLAGGSSGQPQYNNNGVLAGFTMGGDATLNTTTGTLTIASNAITNAKAAQMAANTIKGNNTGSTANASDLTVAQTQALLAPAWTSYTPTLTCDSGSLTSASASGKYYVLGKTTHLTVKITITTAGTCGAHYVSFSLPNTSQNDSSVHGQEIGVTGVAAKAFVGAAATTGVVSDYANASLVTNGSVIVINGTYENQ